MLAFLSPLFLAGAAAAAIPLVLHLLKREPEPRVRFAAVRWLKQAPVEHTEKRHVRELLLLALRIAVLALLALAFARPFFPSGAAAGASAVTMIAIDTSYSMSAPGRIARARQLAKDAMARVPSGDLVGLVAFADEAEILMPPGTDRILTSATIDRVTAGFGATRYRAALSAASQHLTAGRGTIVVVTDLQESGWDAGDRASVPEGAKIDIADVGAAPSNLAVTAVRPMADRVIATIRNAGPRPRDARVHLTIDNRAAGDASTTVGPNQSADVTFAGAPRGAAAAVTVEDPDGLAADNVRYAVLGGTSQPTVLVVTGSGDVGREAFYVQQALAAGAAPGQGYRAAGISAARLSSFAAGGAGRPGSGARLDEHAAVVLLSTRGLERRGREALAAYTQQGGGLFVAAGPDVDGDVAGDVIGGASTLRIVRDEGVRQAARTLAPADGRHPIFQPFAGTAATLGLVTFQSAARISGDGCQTLARFTTGEAAMLECPAGDGRALVLASDLDNRWNDFPRRATFVPFLHEVVRYLASAHPRATEYLVGEAPAGVARVPGIVSVADAARPGASARRVAINVDPREADAARITVDEFESAVTRLKPVAGASARVEARQEEDRQHLWQYALALMVAMLVVEGFVASRTA
ncbi:MAG: VWA domain-containing protein [Acidobacteria bacterium]|nr:VWA domain-containing protein [Acidobacteriota bacterium]